jgi:hypothetical protein
MSDARVDVAMDPRFLRQVILVEVGPAGQRRLARSSAAVGGTGLAFEVATRYAERAGFAEIVEEPRDASAAWSVDGAIDVDEAIVATKAAAEVLKGSRAALRAILAAAKGGG